MFTCNDGYEPVPSHITNITSPCELKDDDSEPFKKEARFEEPTQNISCVGQFLIMFSFLHCSPALEMENLILLAHNALHHVEFLYTQFSAFRFVHYLCLVE